METTDCEWKILNYDQNLSQEKTIILSPSISLQIKQISELLLGQFVMSAIFLRKIIFSCVITSVSDTPIVDIITNLRSIEQ